MERNERKASVSSFSVFLPPQYADQNRHVDALNAWRNATMLKPEHSLAWNNMVILLDNTGTACARARQRRCLWGPDFHRCLRFIHLKTNHRVATCSDEVKQPTNAG